MNGFSGMSSGGSGEYLHVRDEAVIDGGGVGSDAVDGGEDEGLLGGGVGGLGFERAAFFLFLRFFLLVGPGIRTAKAEDARGGIGRECHVTVVISWGVTRSDFVQCNWPETGKLIYSIQKTLVLSSLRLSRPRYISMAQTIELAQVAFPPCHRVHVLTVLQTGKRDYLKSLEKKYQDRWQSERLFEVDPPSQDQVAGLSKAELQQKYPKWFGNYPYPYMNGSLHLGHAFTISKIEFAAGYERMLGKRALFPHGFHVTGMPIKVRPLRQFCPLIRF